MKQLLHLFRDIFSFNALSRFLLPAFLVLALSSSAVASHFKGGQITYQYRGGGQYDILIKGYWDYRAVGSVHPRYEGKHLVHDAPLTVSKTLLPDGKTIEHVQRQTVTWAEPGTYQVYWMTCCRAVGANFNNNENGLFTVIRYDPSMPSSSPRFFDLPIFNYKGGNPIQYTLNMEDPDGHEQTYSLEIPYGLPADAYHQMLSSGFDVSPDGTIQWENPLPGLWLVNVKLQEKVNGLYNGAYITREFLINVHAPGGNTPPAFEPQVTHVVKEGQPLKFDVKATDAEVGQVRLDASGTVYDKGASFIQKTSGQVATGTFTWTPPMGAAGTYRVQFVATDNGSTPLSAQINVVIRVEACPAFQATLASRTLSCQGSATGSVTLSTTGQAAGPFTYSLDGGSTFGADATFTGLAAGSYTGIVRDASGCWSEPVVLTLEDAPSPAVSLTLPSATFCSNAGAVALSGGSPAGGIYQGPGVDQNIFDPAVAGPGQHTLSYSYTSSNGCSSTAAVIVTVTDAPVGDAGADTTVYIGYAPMRCTVLRAGASGGQGPYTYRWSTGENAEQLTVCPDITTTYTLTVTDALGCSDSSQVRVVVEDVTCGSNGDKIWLCHKGKALCVDPAVAENHFAHGDQLGDCSVADAQLGVQQESVVQQATVEVVPNPVTAGTQVQVIIRRAGAVRVDVVDLAGNPVKLLYAGKGELNQVLRLTVGELKGKGLFVGRVFTADGVEYFKIVKH